MPIYKVNGSTYNIPDEKIESFEKRYPDSDVEIYDNDGNAYTLPLNKREAFQKKYDKWTYSKDGIAEQSIADTIQSKPDLQPTGAVESPVLTAQADATAEGGEKPLAQKDGPLTEQEKEKMIAGVHLLKSQTDESIKATGNKIDNLMEYGSKPMGGQTMEGDKVYNHDTGKLEQAYITPIGDKTTDKQAADRVSRQYREAADMSIGGQIRKASKRLEDYRDRMAKRRAELAKKDGKKEVGWLLDAASEMGKMSAHNRMGNINYTSPEDEPAIRFDDEYQSLRLAARKAEEEIDQLTKAQRKAENGSRPSDFFRHTLDAVSDIDGWTFGGEKLKDEQTKFDIDYKISKGEELTDSEYDALYEQQLNDNVMAQFGDLGKWALYGDITGNSLMFMKDFLYTKSFSGLSNKIGTKLATKMAQKNATKLGKDAAESIGVKVAKEGLINTVRSGGKGVAKKLLAEQGLLGSGKILATKALGVTAEDLLVRAPLMVGTVQLQNAVSNTIDTKLGPVEEGEDGNLHFANDKSWGEAAWQTGADMTIENFSEMWGAHLPGMADVTKVFGARGLTAAILRSTREGAGTVLSKTSEFLSKAGVNGYIGEVGEEYYGQLWRTMLNLDSAYGQDEDGNKINNFRSKDFNGDIWAGMALSIGLTGGVSMGANYGAKGISVAADKGKKAVDYIRLKNAVDMSDAVANERLTPAAWAEIKPLIDASDNADIGQVVTNIMTDPSINDKERAAVMDYVEKSLILRGNNLKEYINNRDKVKEDIEDEDLSQAYINGYNAVEREEKVDIKNMMALETKQIEDVFGKMPSDDEINDAVNGTDKAKKDAAIDYLTARKVYGGMVQRVRDDISFEIAQSDAMIDKNTHTDGAIHTATLKDDKEVYIIDGNVQPYDDGSGVDLSNSSNSIIIRYKDTGDLEQVSPESILSIGDIEDPFEQKSTTKAAILETAKKMAQEIDGIITSYDEGDTYTLEDEDGNAVQLQVAADGAGIIDNGDGTVNMSDGKQVFPLSKDLLQAAADAENMSRAAGFEANRKAENKANEVKSIYARTTRLLLRDKNGNTVSGEVIADEDEDGKIQVQTDAPIYGRTVNMFTSDELDGIVVEQNDDSAEQPMQEDTAPIESNESVEPTPTETIEEPKVAETTTSNEPTQKNETAPVGESSITDEPVPGTVQEDVVPTKEDGGIDYVKMGKERTRKTLHDKYGDKMPHKVEVTRSAYESELKKAKTALDKAQSAYDDAPIGKEAKAEEALDKAQSAYESVKKEAEFWGALDEQLKKPTVSDEVAAESAKEILSMEEPLDGEELAASMLAGGALPITQESYMNETGAGKEESKGLFGLFRSKDKGGITIEQAGEQLMLADRENGTNFFDQEDANAGRNAIIEVLSGARTRGDLSGYIQKRREERARKEQEAERNAMESWYEQNVHAAPEEQADYEEAIEQINRSGNYDIGEIDVIFAEKGTNKTEENGEDNKKTISGYSENGPSVLQGEQSGDTGRDRQSQGGREAGENGSPLGSDNATPSARSSSVADSTEGRGTETRQIDSTPIQPKNINPIIDNQSKNTNFVANKKENEVSEQISQGSDGSVATGERAEDGNEPADNSRRIKSGSGQSEVVPYKNENAKQGTEVTVERNNDEQRKADIGRVVDDTTTSVEGNRNRGDIRVFEKGLGTSHNKHSEYSERNRRETESERLVDLAKQNGQFITSDETKQLGRKFGKRTGESVVYLNDEQGKVYKVKDPYAKAALKNGVQPEDAIYEHTIHNLLFPETEYTFEGISEELGDARVVLSQNLIQSVGQPTKEQITEALAAKGLFPEDNYSFGNELVSVTDVEGDNVLLGEDGTVYFIDPIIKFKRPAKEIIESLSNPQQESLGKKVEAAEAETNTTPTEAQKEAGNYKKGHVQVGTFDITIENPKGSERKGTDTNGKEWSLKMQNTYGYFRGTEGVDGDHIDVFLADDIDGWNGRKVFVVDQTNTDGSFDEHKVMLGFNNMEEAENAYYANYSSDWKEMHPKNRVTAVNIDDFEKWIDSSHRKTKPFAEYKNVKSAETSTVSKKETVATDGYTVEPAKYTTKRGKILDMQLVKFDRELTKEEQRNARELAKSLKGWYDREQGGFMMRNAEDAQQIVDAVMEESGETLADAAPLSLQDVKEATTVSEEKTQSLLDNYGGADDYALVANSQDKSYRRGDDTLEVKRYVPGQGLVDVVLDGKKTKLSIPEFAEAMRNGRWEEQSKADDNHKLVSTERYEELKKRMRAKLSNLNMGIDPEILAMGTEMAVYHIEGGARKFAEYAKNMVADMGDTIRPYLKSFYNAVRDMPEAEELVGDMDAYEDVRKFDVANFDKQGVDVLAQAEQTAKELTVEAQATTAKKEITDQRNTERRKESTENQNKTKKKEVSLQQTTGDLFAGLFGAEENEEEEVQKVNDDVRRRFSTTVANDMLQALEYGTKPYRSIIDLRKRAKAIGMEVDDDGRTDILLQELVEDGLVRAARKVVESKGRDTKESFDDVCKLYEMQPTIAARSSNRIKMQQYSTPLPMSWVADFFAMYGQQDANVLEPTAGNGMLVFTIPATQVHVNELDETRLSNLREQGFAQVTSQDATEPFEEGKEYQAVVMNPPFGYVEAKEYDGKSIAGLDPQITLNALANMKDDGRAAIIIGGNMEYANNGAIKGMKPFFTYLYDHYNVKGVVDMDGKLYAKQGTTYPTRMILIDGRRSEEERAQTAVYPPIESKAIPKATTFDELYSTVNNIIENKEKTNGTEILRSKQGQLVSVGDKPSGRTNGERHSGQPTKDDGNGHGGRGAATIVVGATERSESVLRGEHRENLRDGETTRATGGSERGRVGGDTESAVQRVGTVGVPTDGVGLKVNEKRTLTEEKLPYRPHNSAFSLESVAPAAMVEAMDNVLSKIEERYGNIDEFVTKELGYDTIEDTHNALAAEQMDSVAMAIYQMKQGQALIIGDQTGVGKGRQMAALIRWAVKQGEKPVFVTQKADLFSDIYRDLVDVGSGDLVPFIFNSDGAMVDSNGQIVHKPISSSQMAKVFSTGEIPNECDFAILTYSQVNTGDEQSQKEMEEAAKKNRTRVKKSKATKDGKATPKATFLRAIAKNNYLFFDESHTAAGSSNTGAYLQSILKEAKAVTFASATFAKRPDTMPIYALRTSISKAKVEANKMIEIIEKGGVTLQEIMSRALTQAGQMVRRERDMSDVKTDWKTIDDPKTVQRSRENYDKTIAAFNSIIKFQEEYVKPKIDALDEEIAVMAESAGVKKGTDKMGVENVPFASKTYNYTKQLMLALKVDAIADEVEREIKAGRHPVIALESTMEASIKDYAANDVIYEPTFSASLLKGLDTVMQYTIKDENGKETHRTYSPKELGKEGEKAYYELQKFIRESTSEIFISPLDAIIERLHEKGFKVGELTGRNMYVEKNDKGEVVVRRRTDKDKKRMQRDFNNGTLDVLILNKSASTGISLHASEKFSDQRQRSMIIAQPLSDINDYMQMIGRIDRTGQAHRGYYINLGLPVPAEQRFLMMLSTKLKSLNANTTTSQDSESNDVEAPDLLNKYGSQVVVEYLRDNPEIYEKIGTPLKKSGTGTGRVQTSELDEYKPQEDDARRITGYVALLSTQEQEDFYNDVVRRYNELIKHLNDTGNNDLKITVMPLRAKTLERKVSSTGIDPNSDNPFAQNSYVEQIEMDVLRKPMKADDIKKTIEQINNGEDAKERLKEIVSTINEETKSKKDAEISRYEKAQSKAAEDIAKQTEKINASQKRTDEEKRNAIARYTEDTNERARTKHEDAMSKIYNNDRQIKNRLNLFEVGKSYLVPDNLESLMFDFSSPAIFCGYKAKDSKITASTTLAVFATLDGRRRVEVKLSQFDALNSISKATNDNWDSARSTTLENWDSQIQTESRKVGYVMTGNILQAIADTQDEKGGYVGQLISYSDIDGGVHDGILMPDKWNSTMLKNSGVPLISRISQIKNYETVVSHDGKVEINGNKWGEQITLTVPKTKKEGGIYFTNDIILNVAVGHNFYPYRGKLRADIPAKYIDDVVKELTKLGVKIKEERNDDDVMMRDDEVDVNERFNEDLQEQMNGTLPYGHVYELGMPSEVLLSAGIPNLPIEMASQRLVHKSNQYNHPFDLSEVKDLPYAIQNPLAVFDSATRLDSNVILTELKQGNKNFVVAVETNRMQGRIQVNSIRSIHPRTTSNIVSWINDNLMSYANKDSLIDWLSDKIKTRDYLNSSNPADVRKSLVSATNVVNNFENQTFEEEINRTGVEKHIPTHLLRKQMTERVNELAKKLHLGNVEVVSNSNGLDGKRRRAKGFYTKSTGKITVVIGNHTSIADVEKTLLHEAVAHYGLRKMFGEHFDTFLDNVFNNADEKIRREIVAMATKNGWDFRKATEEYLAGLAENTNFEEAKQSGWWNKVKELFGEMLHKIGLSNYSGVITDNEIRYVLWRSYENLKENKYSGLMSEAADIAKQYELGVGESTNTTKEDTLYRDGDPEVHERALARDRYEQRVRSGMYQSREALQDSMLGLKEAMSAILGKKDSRMEDIDGFENAYLGENRLSSVNKAEADAFAHTLFKPMLDEVAKLARNEAEREELTDYMMAKHGLERNVIMAERDAQKEYDSYIAKHPNSKKTLQDFIDECRKRDYAGLTALTGIDVTADAEQEAQRMVDCYELGHKTTKLWNKVNAVNNATLSKLYECGLMNKETFDEISGMYKFYIPLRGFDEKTSAEEYAYLNNKHSAFNAPIKKAGGRGSKADDPFAYMQSMMESAIMQGNRNVLVKQRFLNFVLNHPSDLASVSDLWLEYDAAHDIWKPVFPNDIDVKDTAAVVEQKIRDFDDRMKQLAASEPDRYKHGKDATNIPYRVVNSFDEHQHQVIVKRDGRDYLITINGNPRAAQALNGMTNPDNDISGVIGAVANAGEYINRKLSAMYTTRDPDFIVSNYIRDMLYSNTMVWVKESTNYALRFNRHTAEFNIATMKRLFKKYRLGVLDMNNETEKMFHQFMVHGGETGYSNVRDIEQHKSDINRELKKANGTMNIERTLSLLGERFDEVNRAVENSARFSAFVTSREMGRTIDRSIYDAKEISVNFNKKGSGAKFWRKTGTTAFGNFAALVSGFGRAGFVFWNAAIQGTTNFGRQFKRHPAKAFTGVASMFILGALIAGLGGDDDDEESNYYDLPEYVRRSNIIFKAGGYWISITLPIEYRAIYGMGELMMSTMSGKENMTGGELASSIAGQMSQILPIDFMEGGGGLNAFVPSSIKPIIESYVTEKGWTGLPLYKGAGNEDAYNKYMPGWTKAFKSSNKHIVGMAAALNEATGGDAYTRGVVNINPARVENMLTGYFGGVYKTIDKLMKTAETIAGTREPDPKSILIVNRLVKVGDERTEYRAVNNEYKRLEEEHKILSGRLRGYENDTYNGVFDYAEKIDFLYNSPEYTRYEIFEGHKKNINALNEELKSTVDDEYRKVVEYELNELKKQMIDEVNETRK